jgi:putative cell wall-binding protein
MKKIVMIKLFSIVLLSCIWTTVFSQSKTYKPVSKELYDTIMKKDSILFGGSQFRKY